MSLQSYAVVLGTRYLFGGTRAVGADTQRLTGLSALRDELTYAVHDPSLFSWPILLVLMMSPWAVWIHRNRACIDRGSALLLVAATAVALLTLLFGFIMELRVLIPSLAMVAIVAVRMEQRRGDAVLARSRERGS
jgi:hypothetical protein